MRYKTIKPHKIAHVVIHQQREGSKVTVTTACNREFLYDATKSKLEGKIDCKLCIKAMNRAIKTIKGNA